MSRHATLFIAFAIVGVLFVVPTSAKWIGCGGSCNNNNQCDDALCSYCDPMQGICVSGGTCNTSCTVDSDCERLRYCYQCVYQLSGKEVRAEEALRVGAPGPGTCLPGPAYPYQCGPCNSDADCDHTNSNCVKCLADKYPNGTTYNRCSAGCNGTCASNYDCGYGASCSSCDQTTKTCQPGSACGAQCGEDGDCDQSPNATCTKCVDLTCSAPCASACNSNYDCNAPITGCGQCLNSTCAPGTTCGSRCLFDRDCASAAPATNCTNCVNGQCVPGNSCGTGRPCVPGNNNLCPIETCSRCDPFTATCMLGGPCGMACFVDTDCDQLGACNRCLNTCVDNGAFKRGLGLPEDASEELVRKHQDEENERRSAEKMEKEGRK